MEQNSIDTQNDLPGKSDIESHEHLLKQVRDWMKRKGVKQTHLQKQLDQLQSNVNAALTGRNLSLLVQIAQHLIEKYKVDPKEFFPNHKNWRQQMQEAVSSLTSVVAKNQEKHDLALTLIQKQIQETKKLADSVKSLLKFLRDS